MQSLDDLRRIIRRIETHQPVPPVGAFQPVEFEGLTVTPWIEEKNFGNNKRGVMRFSIRATGFKESRKSAGSTAQAAASTSAAATEKKAS